MRTYDSKTGNRTSSHRYPIQKGAEPSAFLATSVWMIAYSRFRPTSHFFILPTMRARILSSRWNESTTSLVVRPLM